MYKVFIPEIKASLEKYKRLLIKYEQNPDGNISASRLYNVGKELRANIQELNNYLDPNPSSY